jgi:hypothetical protein
MLVVRTNWGTLVLNSSRGWRFLFQSGLIDIWTRPISPVLDDEYSYAVAFVSHRKDGYPYLKSVTLAEIGLTSAWGYEFQVRQYLVCSVLINHVWCFSYSWYCINILQDLYNPDTQPKMLGPDSILTVRVNPSGELHFFHLLFHIRHDHIFIIFQHRLVVCGLFYDTTSIQTGDVVA